MASIHWFNPQELPYALRTPEMEQYIGVYNDVVVETDDIDDIVRDIRVMTGCEIYPLGQVFGDMGTPHYTFLVHPNDVDTFAMARLDTRYRGQLAWAHEELPDDLSLELCVA